MGCDRCGSDGLRWDSAFVCAVSSRRWGFPRCSTRSPRTTFSADVQSWRAPRCRQPLGIVHESTRRAAGKSRIRASADDSASTQPGLALSVWNSVLDSVKYFPAYVLCGAVLAVVRPSAFSWFTKDLLVGTLCLIMLCMGLSTSTDEFRSVAERPELVLFGASAQFTIMPLLGTMLARVARLDSAFTAGLLLVATAPGGTASNLVCLLGGANVALSILMTLASTCASVIATPLLMTLLAGQRVAVDGAALLGSTMQVVLAPLLIGAGLRRLAPRAVDRVGRVTPLLSVIGVTLICASVVAKNAAFLSRGTASVILFATVFALHFGGFSLGYAVSAMAGHDTQTSRTVSIEIGMQNSGLAAALAAAHFASTPHAALPAALSATMHSIMGSILAAWWQFQDSHKLP
mmetsp:Transcript_16144/g.35005  ORF Transcript_16144/g.35005 Transcript_16144/m.35005 type:complete len:404 (-) Transcript_16144:2085-3296(-)